jgi:hypothetical protein
MPTFGPTTREYYKEINKAHLIGGIDMLIQAIHLPMISGFPLDKFHK